jgi:hypothetical protein
MLHVAAAEQAPSPSQNALPTQSGPEQLLVIVVPFYIRREFLPELVTSAGSDSVR